MSGLGSMLTTKLLIVHGTAVNGEFVEIMSVTVMLALVGEAVR